MKVLVDKLIENILKAVKFENENRNYNKEKEIDIVDFLAVFEQHLYNDKYSELHESLKNDYYVLLEDNEKSFYNMSKFIIQFQDWQNISYNYEIGLGYDQRSWGYCQCESTDEWYDERHDCCGHACDWYAPLITITKIDVIGVDSFNGYERDLWEYQDKYYNVTLEDKKKIEMDIKLKSLIEQKDKIESQIKELNELME